MEPRAAPAAGKLRKTNERARVEALARLKEREGAAAARTSQKDRPPTSTSTSAARPASAAASTSQLQAPRSRPQAAASAAPRPKTAAAAPSRPRPASAPTAAAAASRSRPQRQLAVSPAPSPPPAAAPAAAEASPVAPAAASPASPGAGAAEPEPGPGFWPLPDELLSVVLAQVPVQDRARLARVSRSWRAAALGPPPSPAAAFRIWLPDESGGAGPSNFRRKHQYGSSSRPKRIPPPPGTVPPDAAACALRSPLCAGLRDLALEWLFEDVSYSGHRRAADRILAIGEAVPPGVERLSIVVGRLYGIDDACLALAMRLPLLKDFSVQYPDGHGYIDIPLHRGLLPALETAGSVTVGPPDGERISVDQLRARAPKLRAVRSLSVADFAAEGGTLRALASAGYSARHLRVSDCRLDLNAASAVGALLRRPPGGPGPVVLSCSCTLAGPWPSHALESVERLEIRSCRFDAAFWRWLTHSAVRPALRQLFVSQYDTDSFLTAAPFIATLADSMPEGAHIRMTAPRSSHAPEVARFLERLLASPKAIRATEVILTGHGGFANPARTAFSRYSTARSIALRPSVAMAKGTSLGSSRS
eukprot:tig00020704_g13181.t1